MNSFENFNATPPEEEKENSPIKAESSEGLVEGINEETAGAYREKLDAVLLRKGLEEIKEYI